MANKKDQEVPEKKEGAWSRMWNSSWKEPSWSNFAKYALLGSAVYFVGIPVIATIIALGAPATASVLAGIASILTIGATLYKMFQVVPNTDKNINSTPKLTENYISEKITKSQEPVKKGPDLEPLTKREKRYRKAMNMNRANDLSKEHKKDYDRTKSVEAEMIKV